jgi:hypothetical protein
MAIQCSATDVHLTNAAANGFTASTDEFSICTWVNAVWNSGIRSMVGMYGETPTFSTAVQIGSRANGLVSCWTWGAGVLIASPTVVTNNTWLHVVYTHVGGTHRLYIDGALVNTTTTAQIAGQFTNVYINGYPTGVANETSPSLIDSYAYYNRRLSDEEVLTMFTAHGARHNNVYGLIAAYEFDELAAGSNVATVRDLSGNGNDLNPTGAGATPITYVHTGTVASSNIRRVH